MTTEEMILKVLRAQAWERAKGELRAVLHTFFDGENFEEKDALWLSELLRQWALGA